MHSLYTLLQLFPQPVWGIAGLSSACMTRAVCDDNLSHAEGLKFMVEMHSGAERRLSDSHLEVEAGQADGIILLLFALSFLQQQNTR